MHIRKLLVASVAMFPSACLAQYYGGGGAYSIERWDEDYSYLKDPSARTDFFDPIKYVPIGENSYLSFGGQARYRFDYFNNPSFGPGTNDEDGFHLQRYLLHADAHVGDNLRAFVQLDSSFVDGREGGGRYGDADNIDLQQAFVDLKTSDKSDPYAFLRLGRQELIYGAQRFISPDDWRNVRRSFDGGKFSLSVPNDTLDVFWVRPVVIEKERFDNDDYGASFAGIYNVTSLPNLIPNAGSKLDLYALALNQTRHSTLEAIKADADTYTLGARFHTLPKPFDFDIEGDYQFGDIETKTSPPGPSRRSSATPSTPSPSPRAPPSAWTPPAARPTAATASTSSSPRPTCISATPISSADPTSSTPTSGWISTSPKTSRCTPPNTSTGGRTPTTASTTSPAPSSAPTTAPTPISSATNSISP